MPQLFARICKTFSEAIEPDKSLPTIYGGVVGLSVLGVGAIRSLLLPQLDAMQQRLANELTNVSPIGGDVTIAGAVVKRPRLVQMTNDAAAHVASSSEDTFARRSSTGDVSKQQDVENCCEHIRTAVLDALGNG